MQIIESNGKRTLIKDYKQEIDISDGQIVSYTGIYYKKLDNDIFPISNVETAFIGKIECNRFYKEDGIIGIYIKPHYIWSTLYSSWYKIVNYINSKQKYFYYPHLLMLPNYHYNYLPIYNLHTVETNSINLIEIENSNKTFDLKLS